MKSDQKFMLNRLVHQQNGLHDQYQRLIEKQYSKELESLKDSDQGGRRPDLKKGIRKDRVNLQQFDLILRLNRQLIQLERKMLVSLNIENIGTKILYQFPLKMRDLQEESQNQKIQLSKLNQDILTMSKEKRLIQQRLLKDIRQIRSNHKAQKNLKTGIRKSKKQEAKYQRLYRPQEMEETRSKKNEEDRSRRRRSISSNYDSTQIYNHIASVVCFVLLFILFGKGNGKGDYQMPSDRLDPFFLQARAYRLFLRTKCYIEQAMENESVGVHNTVLDSDEDGVDLVSIVPVMGKSGCHRLPLKSKFLQSRESQLMQTDPEANQYCFVLGSYQTTQVLQGANIYHHSLPMVITYLSRLGVGLLERDNFMLLLLFLGLSLLS